MGTNKNSYLYRLGLHQESHVHWPRMTVVDWNCSDQIDETKCPIHCLVLEVSTFTILPSLHKATKLVAELDLILVLHMDGDQHTILISKLERANLCKALLCFNRLELGWNIGTDVEVK